MSMETYLDNLKNAKGECVLCGQVSHLSKEDIKTISMIGIEANLWFTCRNSKCPAISFNDSMGRIYLKARGVKTLFIGRRIEVMERPDIFDGSWY